MALEITSNPAKKIREPQVIIADSLSESQRQEVRKFVVRHRDVFSITPGKTNLIVHDIVTEPSEKVHLPRLEGKASAERSRKWA